MSVNQDGSYTEVKDTTKPGYGERVGGSFKSMGAGFAMIAAATGLLWWNEYRSVRTGDAIAEAQGITVELPSAAKVDPAFEGKLVRVAGRADTGEMVTDPTLGVSVKALQLSRKVEYYQWVESSHSEKRPKAGGGEETVTTYTYDQEWMSRPVESSSFKNPEGHRNHVVVQGLEDARWLAKEARLGAYRLPEFAVAAIGGGEHYQPELTEEQRRQLNVSMFGNAGRTSYEGGVAGALSRAVDGALNRTAGVWTHGRGLYIGGNPSLPNVGDIRVTYTMTPPADVTLIAQVTGDTFKKYTASNGAEFSSLAMGNKGMDAMFASEKRSNAAITWAARAAGVGMAIGGFKIVLGPLAAMASAVPLLASIVAAGAGLVASLLGGAWSCLVIAVAWIRFRPVLGFGLLAAAVALTAAVFLLRGKKPARS